MYLAELFVENFRVFGSEADSRHLSLSLGEGLNVFVGENDSGKSSIIDAVRLLLAARTQDAPRLNEDDFHVRTKVRANQLTIRGTFKGLTEVEISRFLEYLSLDRETPTLVVTLQANRREGGGRARRVFVTTRAGWKADGPPLEGEIREFLQATYLRPLRDAEAELSGGRGSRLSQILEAHPEFKNHSVDDSRQDAPPTTLVGIMRKAELDVQNSRLVKDTATKLSRDYLGPLSLGSTSLSGVMGIARSAELRHVLEKLELWLAPDDLEDLRTRRGLGLNNILFMAAELLLLTEDPEASLALLLVEEPEAHLHPQLQARLIEFLEKRSTPPTGKSATSKREGTAEVASSPASSVQILLTTHSPHFAAKISLERLILVSGRRCFPMTPRHTKLVASDYEFLRRFLDVTKANLFFARGVIIVEGDAENLLLPVIAEKLGRPLAKHGVSLVNVGSRALARYARIFQRTDGQELDLRVACVTDLDLVPEGATYAKKKKKVEQRTGDDDDQDENVGDGDKLDHEVKPRAPQTAEARAAILKQHDGGPLKTFVSPYWTLEHDLARTALACIVHRAVYVGVKSRNRAKNGRPSLSSDERRAAAQGADVAFQKLTEENGDDREKIALEIYEPLFKSDASKAEVAELLAQELETDGRSEAEWRSILPTYIVQAIDYVTRNDTRITHDGN